MWSVLASNIINQFSEQRWSEARFLTVKVYAKPTSKVVINDRFYDHRYNFMLPNPSLVKTFSYHWEMIACLD